MAKKLFINIILVLLTLTLSGATQIRSSDFRKLAQSLPGSDYQPQESKPANFGEPSCDELRLMWRFSKRQSRAAELTNEIPTYRDPFAYNIWEKYPKARSVVGAARGVVSPPRSVVSPPPNPGRVWTRPVYGRVVEIAPAHHPRVMQAENPRVYEGVLRYLEPDNAEESRRRNYGVSNSYPQPNRVSPTGSFQRLKELVWAERMKELHQQRMIEEASSQSQTASPKEVKSTMEYPKPFQGQQRSTYVDPFSQDKNTRLKMITDPAYNSHHHHHHEEDNNNGDVNEDPMYRRPYRQRATFISEPEYW